MTATLVATVKNEGPYLLEWVAHHRVLGFTNIIIFQNDSDDFTDQTLKTLRRMGVIQYFYNRCSPGSHQVRAYIRASRNEAYQSSDWVLALDLDEFLMIDGGAGRLTDLIALAEGHDQLVLNWRMYGNNGHSGLSEDLVLERFTGTEPQGRIVNSLCGFKSFFRRPHYQRPGIHNPRGWAQESNPRILNGSGLGEHQFELLNWRSKDPAARRFAQINHYAVRDTASYLVKNARGSAHQDNRRLGQKYWRINNYNTVQDHSAARLSAPVHDEMRRLDAGSNGRLMLLRKKALRRHRKKFDALMQDHENVALFNTCLGFSM